MVIQIIYVYKIKLFKKLINKNLLISLNADSFLYLWETAEAEDYLQSLDGRKIIFC